MYKNIKILDPKAHAFYRYTPAKDFYYAKDMNLIPITYSEIKYLCCEYPIVIIMIDEKPKLMLMTGVKENNAIDDKGQWKIMYPPYFVRKYPFALIRSESDDTFYTGFDLESGLFSSPEGSLLFDAEGKPTSVLENINKLLTAYQKETHITENVLLKMKEFGLLQPAEFMIKKEDGVEQKVEGFFTIDKKKFLEQEDDFLLKALKSGWMEIIELHHLSLSKAQNLRA